MVKKVIVVGRQITQMPYTDINGEEKKTEVISSEFLISSDGVSYCYASEDEAIEGIFKFKNVNKDRFMFEVKEVYWES